MDGSRVCGIIVTYNCGDAVVKPIEAVLSQINHLVAIDNHSDLKTIEALEKLRRTHGSKITVVRNTENVGLAAALNQGVAFAVRESFDFVLTMDQDSLAKKGMVVAMLQLFQSSPQLNIGVASPNTTVLVDKAREHGGIVATNQTYIETDLVWTGGSLIPISVFEKVGLFRADFFIDHVDYEFCFRVKKAGYKIVQVVKARLLQPRGELTTAYLLGRRVFCSNYSPARRYYIARNGIVLSREINSLKYLRMTLQLILTETAKAFLFEEQKLLKIVMTLRGISDGLANRLEPLPS